MENQERREIKRYSGSEILESPNLLEAGKRVFILTHSGIEKEGTVGVITEFNKEKNTLFISSFDGKVKYEIKINNNTEIVFF